MNDWNAIRAFYREAMPDVTEAGAAEWGIDPYLWDSLGIISFTPIETWLWADIRECGAILYPQFPVARYFVDFANPVAKVAVECDGAAYHDAAKDAARDAELRRVGWCVYRAPGWLCRTDSDPETGKPGEAHNFIARICELHGISRQSRERGTKVHTADISAEALYRGMQREYAICSAARRARSHNRTES